MSSLLPVRPMRRDIANMAASGGKSKTASRRRRHRRPGGRLGGKTTAADRSGGRRRPVAAARNRYRNRIDVSSCIQSTMNDMRKTHENRLYPLAKIIKKPKSML
ncbi:hypothetical protein ACPRNU_08685 [Chromobacterium vaccinii]|uniref:hypothetical protein n=1 Tax=Chromobacterium vaccinii TaxID=1108595 RepID=UPI003C72E0E4